MPDFANGEVSIPIVFMGLMIIVASMVGYYPFDDIYGYGKQVFIRVDNKRKWWISKCVWTFATVIAFYTVLYMTIIIYCICVGENFNLSYGIDIIYHTDYLYIGNVQKGHMLMYLFVTPVIYSIMISFIQVTLSLVTGPLISFLCVMLYHIAGIFMVNKGLMINYCMIFRDKNVSMNDINPINGIIYMMLPIALSFVAGCRIIKRKEIFEK